MSKIEEMALAYGNKHQGTVDIEVFEAGANAVLREIEKIYDGSISDPTIINMKVILLIQELKGE